MKKPNLFTITMLAYGPVAPAILKNTKYIHPRREVSTPPRCVAVFFNEGEALKFAHNCLDSEFGYYNYAVLEQFVVPGWPYSPPNTRRFFRLVGCRNGEDRWVELKKTPRYWRNIANFAIANFAIG